MTVLPGPRATTSRRTVLGAAATTAVLAGAATHAVTSQPAQSAPARRRRGSGHNVVVVSIDDLGWREMGCYGNTFNETPEIDRMAREGLRFTQAYAAAPLCSPTRAALVTGRYPARSGITDFLRPEGAASDTFLDPRERTLPRVLGAEGYTSGLIGKWHLTETYSGPYADRPGNPFAHGFDDVRVSEELYIADGDYTHPYFFMPTLPARTPGEYLTDRLADEAEDFIATHRDEPFFLHVSNYAVHSVWEAKPELREKYRAKPDADVEPNRPVLAAMLESIDQQVGRIRRALETHGIARDTLVLVTSDNGGSPGPALAPLRGGKGQVYEGGIRVPLVAWGPGLVAPGRTSDTVVSTIDVLPTAAALAGARPPRGRGAWDGVDLTPTLAGRGFQVEREATYWVYPHFIGGTKPAAAVRVGDEKLVMHLRRREVALYDLAADESESVDLSAERPEATARLRRLLEQHLDELDLYPGPPDERGPRSRRRREVEETFDGDLSGYTVAAVPSGAALATAEVAGGRLRITANPEAERPSHLLVVSEEGPRGDEFVLVLDPGRLHGTNRERTVFAGLARTGHEADDHLLVRYRHDLKRLGWDLRRGGRLVTSGQEALVNLDDTLDLGGDGARLAVVVRDATAAVYAVEEADRDWQFLFRFDVAGAMDLRDDDVRRELRYAVGARVREGAVLLDGFTAWER